MGNDLSSVISGAGDVVGFTGLGAAIGSIFPGVGTLIGGLIGLAVGSGKEAVTVSRFVDAQRAGNGPALSGSYLASQIGTGIFGAITGAASAVTGGGTQAASILGGTVAKSAIQQTGMIAARKGIQAVTNRAATAVAGTAFQKPVDAIKDYLAQNPGATPGQVSHAMGSNSGYDRRGRDQRDDQPEQCREKPRLHGPNDELRQQFHRRTVKRLARTDDNR